MTHRGAVDRSKESYGRRRLNRGAWLLPRDGRELPVVVLVHGGFWSARYDRHLEDPLAEMLAGRGLAVWNIDYRGKDAPWPATFSDVSAAVDHLTTSRHTDRLDLARVAVVGHSAGGHLALWSASRSRLPAGAVGAGPRVKVGLVVAQAPVTDLVTAARQGVGGGAVQALMGGGPDEQPERYAVGSPLALLPVPDVRVVLVHGDADPDVPVEQSRIYHAAAERAGMQVDLHEMAGEGHYEHLDPTSRAVGMAAAALDAV